MQSNEFGGYDLEGLTEIGVGITACEAIALFIDGEGPNYTDLAATLRRQSQTMRALTVGSTAMDRQALGRGESADGNLEVSYSIRDQSTGALFLGGLEIVAGDDSDPLSQRIASDMIQAIT